MSSRAQHVEATATVDFVAVDGEQQIAARISDEALCHCFAGFYGLEDPLVGAYLKNARVIDSVVVRKARQGYPQPIQLETADFAEAAAA
ncbi:hypothetical protein VVD49_05995 [Uliginosibacterium sp. H3]|uniref:DUF1488 family protein n=1 Tax=Uliginosibacterium silvisoli TaxID=3114758 RepID=A0ABU6K219_9RHOO|nr:hypothetical protein [Uliginosibacterium sp. H3]